MRNVALLVWTAGYSGLVPLAPGTAGSAAGLGLLLGLRAAGMPTWLEPVLLVVVLGLGVWAADAAERHYGASEGRGRARDPGSVVIDEVAGILVTLLWIPVGWGGAAVAFLAFRLFDVVKPFPAADAERLAGGWGVMADDVVAGLYAHLAVRALAWVAPSLVLG